MWLRPPRPFRRAGPAPIWYGVDRADHKLGWCRSDAAIEGGRRSGTALRPCWISGDETFLDADLTHGFHASRLGTRSCSMPSLDQVLMAGFAHSTSSPMSRYFGAPMQEPGHRKALDWLAGCSRFSRLNSGLVERRPRSCAGGIIQQQIQRTDPVERLRVFQCIDSFRQGSPVRLSTSFRSSHDEASTTHPSAPHGEIVGNRLAPRFDRRDRPAPTSSQGRHHARQQPLGRDEPRRRSAGEDARLG